MSTDNVQLIGDVARTSTGDVVDGGMTYATFDRNRALMVRQAESYSRIDRGQYFTVGSTPGTGLAGHAAATTLDNTKPFVWLMSNYTASDGKRIYLDYMKTWVTAAGTNGTDLRYAIKTDTATTRRTSAGTALTATQVSQQSSVAASVTGYAGAIVAAAATGSVKTITHGLLRTVINVVGDEYLFTFGRRAGTAVGMPTEGTLQLKAQFECPGVVLGPTDQFLFHFFSTAQSAASSHEVEIGFWVA